MRPTAVWALLVVAAVVAVACRGGSGSPAASGSVDFRTATPAGISSPPVESGAGNFLPTIVSIVPFEGTFVPPQSTPTVPAFAETRLAAASEETATPERSIAVSGPELQVPWYVPAEWADRYRACLDDPERFDRTTWILTVPWPRAEAEYVADHEGGWNGCQFNTQGSAACGWFQLLPCPPDGLTAEGQIRGAYAKWLACGGSFECAWYRWWR